MSQPSRPPPRPATRRPPAVGQTLRPRDRPRGASTSSRRRHTSSSRWRDTVVGIITALDYFHRKAATLDHGEVGVAAVHQLQGSPGAVAHADAGRTLGCTGMAGGRSRQHARPRGIYESTGSPGGVLLYSWGLARIARQRHLTQSAERRERQNSSLRSAALRDIVVAVSFQSAAVRSHVQGASRSARSRGSSRRHERSIAPRGRNDGREPVAPDRRRTGVAKTAERRPAAFLRVSARRVPRG